MRVAHATDTVAPEINVLPLIDVLLVMIVMFFLLHKVRPIADLQLPPPSSGPAKADETQIVMEIRPDGAIAVNGQPVLLANLETTLHQIYQYRAKKLLFVKAHDDRIYGEVIHAIDLAKGAGVEAFAMVPRPASGPRR